MKRMLFVVGFCVFAWGSSADTNCIFIPAGEYRLVAGYADVNTNSLPQNATLLKPNPVFGTFPPQVDTYTKTAAGWTPSLATSPAPGFGWIVRVPASATTICFPETLPGPVLPLNLPPGFSLVCCQSYQVATFEDIVGRSPSPGTQVYKHVPGAPGPNPAVPGDTNHLVFTFANGAWTPTVPTAEIGEALWVLQPPAALHPQIVSGGFQFETQTVPNATLDVEYADGLDGSSPWHLLTHLVGSGTMTNVVDDLATNSVTQRFYRLNLKAGTP
jgi:hypothetical protein